MPTEISGSTGVNKIQDGTIVNADINSSAAIVSTKVTGIIGVGQSWTDVLSSRTSGTTYTNSTGNAIMIMATMLVNSTSDLLRPTVGGLEIGFIGTAGGSDEMYMSTSFIVPDGDTYLVTAQGGGGLSRWKELR